MFGPRGFRRKILAAEINQVMSGGGAQALRSGATFYAPRTSSITQSRGSGTPTNTRATVAYVTNNDGYLVTALSGELREQGARRIYNLIADPNAASRKSSDFTAWNLSNATISGGGNTITFGAAAGSGAYVYTGGTLVGAGVAGRTYVASATVSCVSGTVAFQLGINESGVATWVSGDLIATTTPQRFTFTKAIGSSATGTGFLFANSVAGGAKAIIATDAQLEDVTSQTTQTAGDYVSVGVLSAPYHGAGVDGVKYFSTDISGNPIPAATLDGSVVEAAATNLCLQSNAFTTTWTSANVSTLSQNATGPDGGTTAWTVADTVAGVNSFVAQDIAATSGATYTVSLFIAKTTGPQTSYPVYSINDSTTGFSAVTVDTSNGIATVWTAFTGYTVVTSSAVCVSYTSLFWRFALTFTANSSANWTHAFRPAAATTSTQSIGNGTFDQGSTGTQIIYGAQLELGSYATSYIPTTTAAVTRNKDVLDDQVASNLTAAAGTVAFQWTPSHDPSGTISLCGSYVDASNYTALLHDGTKYIWRKRIAGVNYDAELTAAYTNGTTAKISLTWGASGINLAVDGTLGTAHANTDDAQLGTRWQWGADGNGGQQAGAAFKEMYLLPRAVGDADLRAFTT